MKRTESIIFTLVLVLSALVFASGEGKAQETELKTESEKLSYVMGLSVGSNLKKVSGDIDIEIFMRGIEDVLRGREILITREEAQEINRKMTQDMQQKRKSLADKNLKEGAAFLAGNKNKEGVKATESGLQYLVLTEGDGRKPKATDRVKVHYRGTLLDGTEFDSSYKREEPATFQLNKVIRGWTEGLQLMNVGSKHRLFVPSELAYGKRGAGAQIGPNATLIFEVELLDVE
jgi:FKBP-type peptidyl-prolyl cis-trans isomerase